VAFTETVPTQFPIFSVTRAGRFGGFAELGGELSFYGNWVPARAHGYGEVDYGSGFVPAPFSSSVDADDDPFTAAARMMTIADFLGNTQVPMQVAREIAIKDTKEHFDREEDPDGLSWPELSDDYALYKAKLQYPDDILHMTGTLEDRATSHDAWIVIGEALIFDPMALPQQDFKGKQINYGMVHQQGRSDHFLLGEKGQETFPGSGSFYDEDVHSGLPARPFIGLSDQAVEEITGVFATWFAEAENADIGINRAGAGAIIGRTKSGQPRLSSGQFGRKY